MYFFTLSNFKFDVNTKKVLTLQNIPKYLKKYDFEESLSLKCIDDGEKCFLYTDENKIEVINNLFKEKPVVYTYDNDLDIIYYDDIEEQDMQRYEVCFEYNINKYKKPKDIIVEVGQKVYIFDSFTNEVKTLEYISDVREYFDKQKQEVKDAF